MNFFKKLVTSVYKFDEYDKLLKTSFGASLLYYVILSLIIMIVSGFGVFMALSASIDTFFDKIPDFQIEESKLVAEDKVKFDLNGFLVIIDSDAESAAKLEKAAGNDYIQGIFASKNDILINQRPTGMSNTNTYLGLDGLNKNDFKKFMTYSCRIMLFIGYIIFKCFFLLFIGCIAKLVSNIMRGGLNFKDSFKLGIYASTMAVILRCILIYILPAGLPNVIFYGIIIVYMYFAIMNYKRKMIV